MLVPGRSRRVRTVQRDLHADLARRVLRHLGSEWRQPFHPGSRAAFEQFLRCYRPGTRLVLDSGCGTGASTRELAERHPDSLVVGVDRSDTRLGRRPAPWPDNALLLRARLEDFWRLLDAHAIRPARHYILYPNPWPKPRHLMRRWHGHPVLPVLLRLSPVLELRANWRLYLREFRFAARLCGAPTAPVVSFRPALPLSPFERKFLASGHELYRLTLNLENR